MASGLRTRPRRFILEGGRGKHGELPKKPVGQVRAADLLARRVIDDERAEIGVDAGLQCWGYLAHQQRHSVSDTHPRENRRDHRALVGASADIPPPHQPRPIPLSIQPLIDLGLLDPVPRQRLIVRVCEAFDGNVRELSVLRARRPIGVVAEPVVEVMGHLGLVEWQHDLPVLHEAVALQLPARLRQLAASTEQAGVIRHVQHPQKSDSPRVAVRVAVPPEHAGALVKCQVEPRVAPAAKRRTGAGVGVQERDIVRGEAERPLWII